MSLMGIYSQTQCH